MRRKLYDKLVEWKKRAGRKPLLLTGARQVGKTYLLKEFGEKEFENVVYINLDTEKDRYEAVFAGSIIPDEIIGRLEVMSGQKIDPTNTLIILDEVQEIPRALTSLKYFCEMAPEYYVVASGSFLGITLHQGTSFPVGKVETLELAPMDFEEFMMAMHEERFLRVIGSEVDLKIFRENFEMAFRKYLIVGGMPEAVASFADRQDYEEVDKIHNAILLAYLDDFSKHADATTVMRIRQVWNSLPAQFAKRNEKFMFNMIKTGARAREYELAIQWLVDCKIVRKVELLKTGDKLPLKAYVEMGSFKLYFLDVGLFRHLAGATSEMILDSEMLFNEFNGFFAEQFVLQQMTSKYDMYYWVSGASAKVDFVTEAHGAVVPIEVKSGTNVKAKSLRVFRDDYRPKLSVRFSLKELEYNDGLLNVPIYLAGFIGKYFDKYLGGK